MKNFSSTIRTVLLATSFVGCFNLISLPYPAQAQSDQSVDQKLVGTWEGDGLSDASAKQHIVLELRSDGSYTKTLKAIVNGQSYGGTHSGTWKSRGQKVYLSGDGNWPPYVQDLSYLKKIG